jgi:hypothetical protein
MKWFVTQDMFFTRFAVYSAFGLIALLLWWVIYQMMLARRYSLREAIFGENPNAAVALDFLGGMLASGILFFFLLRHPTSRDFWSNAGTLAWSIAGLLVMLAALRLLLEGLLRIWFRQARDAQGDYVNLNNELFKQRNFATGIFSTALYLILVAGMLQIELRYSYKFQLAGVFNMLGVWLLGALTVVLHSFLFLGYGMRNHILHECFHDNNPAAASSLLGLTGGFLLLTNHVLDKFRPGIHIFNTKEMWISVGVMILLVLIVRGIFQLIVYGAIKLSLRNELVVRDNVAWGLLDGGLILLLCLILISFI